jgi:hypothetical protein
MGIGPLDEYLARSAESPVAGGQKNSAFRFLRDLARTEEFACLRAGSAKDFIIFAAVPSISRW